MKTKLKAILERQLGSISDKALEVAIKLQNKEVKYIKKIELRETFKGERLDIIAHYLMKFKEVA